MNTFSPTKGGVRFNNPISIAQAELVASGDYKSFFYGSTPDMTVSMVFASKAEDGISNDIKTIMKTNVPVSGGYEFPHLRLKGAPVSPIDSLTPGTPYPTPLG
jgi:hypothetical protein